MPSKGPDLKKLKTLLKFLKFHPQGVWVREIARSTDLDKSLVSRYLSHYLTDKVEFYFIGSAKMVKLKLSD
ncbi:MAG: helix-turn-helix domain-containing protein [Candidatus Diapherotrites archaeon]